MTALEAYEQAKKQWPTEEEELKGIRSDIAYCVAKGELHIRYSQFLCHPSTSIALKEDGYKVACDYEKNTVLIHWYKNGNPHE